jgi:hypothetical protein
MPEDSEWVTTSNHRTGLTTLCASLPQPRISITTPFANPVPPACSQPARTSNGKCYRLLAPHHAALHHGVACKSEWRSQNMGPATRFPRTTHKPGTLHATPYLTHIIHIRWISSADDVAALFPLFCLLRNNASPLNFSSLFFWVSSIVSYPGSWLRQYATSRKAPSSVPDKTTRFSN